MANIINNNFHNLKMRVNKDEYWDFFINKDAFDYGNLSHYNEDGMYDKCLISFIDSSLDECKENTWLYSTSRYLWDKSSTTEYTLNNIGFTGVDNGLVTYLKDRINNRRFVDIYTNSKFNIEDDSRLKLHQVSGTTHRYDYTVEDLGDSIRFNGGFYQGFFETQCDKYQILPSSLESGESWDLEFTLKKTDFEADGTVKLNDIHPNNKGLFFYIGTRAENKWIYLYDEYNEKDECSLPDIGDYVEGGEIDIKTYGLNNLIDANPDFIDYEEVFFDDYMNFKYFSDDVYESKNLDEDDFFLDDYLVMDTKPNIIDEEKNKHSVIGWCCNYTIEKQKLGIRNICCGCGCCNNSHRNLSLSNTVRGEFFGKCSLFGDDYLADIDEMEDGSNFIEVDLDISDFDFRTNDNSITLKNSGQYFVDTDNKFLTFDRTCDGFNVHSYTSDSLVRYYGTKYKYKDNLFLLLNRTCHGYRVKDLDSLKVYENTTNYNIYNDIYDNALGFRITDNGAIGYRYITLDCDSENGIKIKEAYSFDNVIKENEWVVINVKITALFNTMVLRFYVNGKLVFVSDELRKLNLRKLKEVDEKQEGVAYNISIGGGTQGLMETVLPNYMLNPYRVYPIEENFAGTFIGYFKSFKFYNCSAEYNDIYNNFLYARNIWVKNDIYN